MFDPGFDGSYGVFNGREWVIISELDVDDWRQHAVFQRAHLVENHVGLLDGVLCRDEVLIDAAKHSHSPGLRPVQVEMRIGAIREPIANETMANTDEGEVCFAASCYGIPRKVVALPSGDIDALDAADTEINKT